MLSSSSIPCLAPPTPQTPSQRCSELVAAPTCAAASVQLCGVSFLPSFLPSLSQEHVSSILRLPVQRRGFSAGPGLSLPGHMSLRGVHGTARRLQEDSPAWVVLMPWSDELRPHRYFGETLTQTLCSDAGRKQGFCFHPFALPGVLCLSITEFPSLPFK